MDELALCASAAHRLAKSQILNDAIGQGVMFLLRWAKEECGRRDEYSHSKHQQPVQLYAALRQVQDMREETDEMNWQADGKCMKGCSAGRQSSSGRQGSELARPSPAGGRRMLAFIRSRLRQL